MRVLPHPRRLILTLTLCALAAAARPALAREVVPLTATSDGIETIAATVSGRHGTFLLDSGAGVSAVTPDFAAKIGCKPWAKITGFRATGERLDLPRCNQSEVEIGATKTTLPELCVIDLNALMGARGAGLAGVIGLDALAGRTITLNITRHELVIEDAASAADVGTTATEVPIRLVRDADGAALTADVGVPTQSGTTWMELDTGNYGPSLLDDRLASLFGLDPASAKPQQWAAPVAGDIAISGSVVVKDLILDGNLGREVLQHWLVTLDLAGSRGWIRHAP